MTFCKEIQNDFVNKVRSIHNYFSTEEESKVDSLNNVSIIGDTITFNLSRIIDNLSVEKYKLISDQLDLLYKIVVSPSQSNEGERYNKYSYGQMYIHTNFTNTSYHLMKKYNMIVDKLSLIEQLIDNLSITSNQIKKGDNYIIPIGIYNNMTNFYV